MLADNVQMLTVFSLASSKAQSLGMDARGFQRAAFGIIDWLEREMQASAGGFVTSLDSEAADALGERYAGIQIAWSREQIAEVLGQDAEWACEIFGLNTLGSSDTALMIPTFKHDPEELDQDRLQRVLGALLESRRQRPQPARDEQVVAEWNGLFIDAFVTAALHFDEPNLVNVAERTAEYIWQTHRVAGQLRRSSRDGLVGEALGTAGDLGAMAIGMLRLAAVRGDEVWLERAISLLEEADAHFAAPGGGWFDAAADAEALIYRPRDGSDNFSPSATSLLITANQLASRLGHRERRAIAHRAERSRIQRLLAGPELAGWALHDAILRASARPPAETVVTAPTKAEAWPLAVAAARQAEPAELILIGDATVDSAAFGGLFEARTAVAEPTAYVCREGICELPRTSFRAEDGTAP